MAKRKPIGSVWRCSADMIPSGHQTGSESGGGSVFDELVIDDFLHVEQIHDNGWWIRLGNSKNPTDLYVEVNKRTRKTTVTITCKGDAR